MLKQYEIFFSRKGKGTKRRIKTVTVEGSFRRTETLPGTENMKESVQWNTFAERKDSVLREFILTLFLLKTGQM